MTYVAPTCAFLPDSFVGSPSTFYYVYAVRQTKVGFKERRQAAAPRLARMPENSVWSSIRPISRTSPRATRSPRQLRRDAPAGNVYDDNDTILRELDAYRDLGRCVRHVVRRPRRADAPGSGIHGPESRWSARTRSGFRSDGRDGARLGDPGRRADVDANGNVVDNPCERNVASYYDRQPRQFQCVLSTSTTIATAIYRTTAASFQGQFVTFAPPNSGRQSAGSLDAFHSSVGQATANSTRPGGPPRCSISLREPRLLTARPAERSRPPIIKCNPWRSRRTSIFRLRA